MKQGFSPILILIVVTILAGTAGINSFLRQQSTKNHETQIKLASAPAQISSPSPTTEPRITGSPTNKPAANQPSPNPFSQQTGDTSAIKPDMKLNSVSPSSSKSSSLVKITLKGSRFGSIELGKGQGFVDFYDLVGNHNGGSSAENWTDNEIIFIMPPLKKGQYLIEAYNTVTGNKSNRLPFTVTDGTPAITSSPSSANPGNQITLGGSEFGNTPGKIAIYTIISGKTTYVGQCNVTSWTDNEVRCTLPSSLIPSANPYQFDLTTSDGRNAQWKGFYVCNPNGCG